MQSRTSAALKQSSGDCLKFFVHVFSSIILTIDAFVYSVFVVALHLPSYRYIKKIIRRAALNLCFCCPSTKSSITKEYSGTNKRTKLSLSARLQSTAARGLCNDIHRHGIPQTRPHLKSQSELIHPANRRHQNRNL